MKIVFATNNKNKLAEVQDMLGSEVEVLSLEEIGCNVDIPETGSTLEENALIKARYVFDNYNMPCFADDTGLEIEALGGAPGVYSARYGGGKGHNSEANIQRVMRELKGKANRRARFRTVIALIEKKDEAPMLFEGIVNGAITTKRSGENGFGYDPIFRPDGQNNTFAKMSNEKKNKISHRARAIAKLVEYINGSNEGINK